jgi:hypothetical protein
MPTVLEREEEDVLWVGKSFPPKKNALEDSILGQGVLTFQARS